MLKNRIIPVFALAALVGAAACERPEETRVETPATETITPSPAVDPVTTPGTTTDPMMQSDTMMMHDTMAQDTIL